jgi:hypothetical protein
MCRGDLPIYYAASGDDAEPTYGGDWHAMPISPRSTGEILSSVGVPQDDHSQPIGRRSGTLFITGVPELSGRKGAS